MIKIDILQISGIMELFLSDIFSLTLPKTTVIPLQMASCLCFSAIFFFIIYYPCSTYSLF